MRFTASWDPRPPAEQVTNYNFYFGQRPGLYDGAGSPKAMGNVSSGVVDLDPEGTWYVNLKAQNASGESPFGLEVMFRFVTAPVRGMAPGS